MKPHKEEDKDRAYKTAKICSGPTQLSKVTGIGENTLRSWGKEREFSFKQRFCSNPECGDPIKKTQPEEATLCQLCNMQRSKNKHRERKKTECHV